MNTKRNLIQSCLLGALLWLLPADGQAQTYYYTNGIDIFQYTATVGNATITGYSGSGSAVTVPDAIAFIPVTGLAEGAFQGTSVVFVMLGTNMTKIAPGAFIGCPDLLAIKVDPANPAYSDVEDVLFDKNQTTLEAFPEGDDGDGGTYSIPNSVTNIGTLAFYGCASLTSVPIGTNITSIGQEAFLSCANLTGVTIPNSVTNIGEGAFAGCSSLLAIDVNPANPAYCDVGGVLFDKNQTTLEAFPEGVGGSYSISNRVTSIVLGAFAGSDLTGVTIPNSVTNLGDFAFQDCTNLTSVSIGNGVTSIGEYVFDEGYSLTNVIIGNGVTSIGESMFASCTSLTSIIIPNSVTSIGYEAFLNCTSLTSITIGNGVTNIGDSAFEESYSLTGVYFQGNAPIPNSDTTVFSDGNAAAEVYYQPSATGWGTTFDGLPTSLYFPGSLVVNGNFETGDFTGWTTGFGNSSIITNALVHTGLYAGQFSARRVGSILRPASVYQNLATQPGQAYVVSLWVNGLGNSSSVDLNWDGNALTNATVAGNNWFQMSFVVVATNATTALQFYSASQNYFAVDDVGVVPLAGYNQINVQRVSGGVQFSFVGAPNTDYALDRTFSLKPPITWVPQSTNATDANGMLLLTNAPVTTTNNFWRIRSVP